MTIIRVHGSVFGVGVDQWCRVIGAAKGGVAVESLGLDVMAVVKPEYITGFEVAPGARLSLTAGTYSYSKTNTP